MKRQEKNNNNKKGSTGWACQDGDFDDYFRLGRHYFVLFFLFLAVPPMAERSLAVFLCVCGCLALFFYYFFQRCSHRVSFFVCVWLFFLCVSDPQIGHHLPDGSACFLTPLLLSICLNMIMFFSQSIFRLLYERFLLACFFVSHLYCGVMNYLPVFGNSFIFHFYF